MTALNEQPLWMVVYQFENLWARPRKCVRRKNTYSHFDRILRIEMYRCNLHIWLFSRHTERNVIFPCLIIRSFSSKSIVFFKFSLKTAREIGTTLLVSCGKLIHVVERRTHRQDGGAYTGKVTRVGFAFEISFW